MSRLSEALAAKEGILQKCISEESNPWSLLVLQPWEGKEWALPWSRLESAKFSHEEQFERIDLLFSNHEVVILGENLHWYREELARHKISRFKSYPAIYRTKFRDSEAFISHLEVRLLDAAGQRAQAGLPF
jgi:hypothetical protein